MLKQIKKLEVTVDANNIITDITSDKNTDFFNQYISQAYRFFSSLSYLAWMKPLIMKWSI